MAAFTDTGTTAYCRVYATTINCTNTSGSTDSIIVGSYTIYGRENIQYEPPPAALNREQRRASVRMQADFTLKRSDVKQPCREMRFLTSKWRRQRESKMVHDE